MISLSEHTELQLIIIQYLKICKHNKDYMTVGLGMGIFFSQMYLIVFSYVFIIILYYICVSTRTTMVIVGYVNYIS